MTEQDWCDLFHEALRARKEEAWHLLTIWADWTEDAGLDYAEGLRWLAERKRAPYAQPGQGDTSPRWISVYYYNGCYHQALNILPPEMFTYIKRPDGKTYRLKDFCWFDSALTAIHVAALAAQKVLVLR